MSTDHPWQLFPGQLIHYAIDHLHAPSEFDQIVGFLLLDVGVETLFKVFLTLPEEVTKTNMPYTKRRQAAEGNFHDLVKGVETAAKSAGDRLKGIDLGHVEYFHGLRNKLYHAGNGITVQGKHAAQYASIAMDLLDRLLGIDLKSARQAQSREQAMANSLQEQTRQVQAALRGQIQALERDLRLAIEKVEPAFVRPSFQNQFDEAMEERIFSIITQLDEKTDEWAHGELRQLMPQPLQRFVDQRRVGTSALTAIAVAAANDVVEFLLAIADITFELPSASPAGAYGLAAIYTSEEGAWPWDKDESVMDYWTRVLNVGNDLLDEIQAIRDTLNATSGLGQTKR